MAEQSYRQLRQEPGIEDLLAVPFGADQGSPLVALPWTTGPERQALERFARFMSSAPLQTLARNQNFGNPSPVPATARLVPEHVNISPLPEGFFLRQPRR
jgi:hypothetical protein